MLCGCRSKRESSWLAIVQDVDECNAIALWVCEPRVSLLEKALSYSARSAARPTRPKRCVVVKEHLPASLRACSGVIVLVCRCVCSCVEICLTRSWQGEIVMFSAS